MLCIDLIVSFLLFFFFFNDTATTEIYTLSLHDALPIFWEAGFTSNGKPTEVSTSSKSGLRFQDGTFRKTRTFPFDLIFAAGRSEEHTSELQSQSNLVCRLLLEKKKKKKI